MDSRSFWLLLRRRWMVVVAVGLLGVILGSAYAITATPQYVAESELFVATVGADNTADLAQGSTYSQQQARNYAVVATRQAVLEPVISSLGLDLSVNQLSGMVSASVPLNTSLISISVTDTSPTRASAIANGVATSLTKVVTGLVPKRSDGTSPVRLETVQNATTPAHPSAPNAKLAVLFGLLAGLVAGIGLILIAELVGAKIRTPDQVTELFGVPLLGSIAYDREAVSRPIVTQERGLSLRGEEFRQIRTNLHFVHAGDAKKIFVLTSSVPNEGKSSTTVNLAATLAASGSSVVVVEADLRNPSIGRYLDMEDSIGFTTVLAGDVTLDDALQPWGPDGLQVLMAGQVPPNPSELLGSEHARELVEELRQRFDIVIIDTPPLLPVTDAAIVARMYGGAIIVVGCGRVEVRDLRKTVEALSASGSPILGAIVNLAPITHKERYQRAYARPTADAQASRSRRRAAGKPTEERHGPMPHGAPSPDIQP